MKNAKFLVLILAVFALAALAADKPAAQGPVTLAYQFASGKILSYQETGSQTQAMDIMGQTMTTTVTSSLDFTLTPKGAKGQDFEIGVVIDAAKSDVQSPQGPMSPDMTPTIGKGFAMILSPLGKEIDVAGAKALKFDSPNGGQRDVSSSFQAFFPDLPDKPVKVGDTWPSEDTVVQQEGAGETTMHVVHTNTLDGFETVDGYECARIKVSSTGTIGGTLEQQGMSLTLAIKSVGQSTWYFAVKEGVYVKSENKGSLNGNIEVGAPANMSIGMTGETGGTTRLIKK
ncbi:MAG: hypothetical protein NTZ26_12395 [Candidatus Aminicenantes bacterium]|nr:hypothetical protein [Candidatus Aminicenantes bacterium]